MAQNCLILIIFLFAVFSCDTDKSVDSPYENYFVKYYGGDGDQSAVDILPTSDGNFLVLGNWRMDVASNRIYLLKVDINGNVIWETKLGSSQDYAKDIELTRNGNLVILSDFHTSSTDTDFKLLLISPDGKKIDSATYQSPAIQVGKSVTPLSDLGYIVTGSTQYDTTILLSPNNPDDLSDIFHFRCDADLNFDSFSWKGQYGTGTLDGGVKVFEQSPNNFYVFGSTNQIHGGNPLGKMNLIYYSVDGGGLNGAPNFVGNFDNDTEGEFAMEVPAALGGGYFFVGTETTSSGSVSLHVVKLRAPLLFNSINDEQFDREIAINARRISSLSASASVVGNQGYLVVANEARESGNNIWLTKIDQSGNELWSRSFGSEEDDDTGAAVIELNNGKIFLVGTIRLVNNQSKIVLMKLNPQGQLTE